MKSSSIISAMVGLLISASASVSMAAPNPAPVGAVCTPTIVVWQGDNGGQIGFKCSQTGSTWHYVAVAPPGSDNSGAACSSPTSYGHTMEAVRMMMSLVQSAVLSGKNIEYVHNTCWLTDQVVYLGLAK